jgi:hypothetical protein
MNSNLGDAAHAVKRAVRRAEETKMRMTRPDWHISHRTLTGIKLAQ